jgi:hypothetical protein
LLAPFDAEERRVERNRRIEIADFDVEAEELGNVVGLRRGHNVVLLAL